MKHSIATYETKFSQTSHCGQFSTLNARYFQNWYLNLFLFTQNSQSESLKAGKKAQFLDLAQTRWVVSSTFQIVRIVGHSHFDLVSLPLAVEATEPVPEPVPEPVTQWH